MDGVGGGSQIVQHKLHARRVLGNVQNGTIVGAALVLGVQGGGGRTAPGLATTIDVHVPSTFGQRPVGRFLVQRSLEPQRYMKPVLGDEAARSVSSKLEE